ncbi:MAG: hypothetical protein ACW98I_20675 [Candidatus Hodarchaeales archaeon]
MRINKNGICTTQETSLTLDDPVVELMGSTTLTELEEHFVLSADTINRTINQMHKQGIVLKRKDLKPLRVILNLAHFLINDFALKMKFKKYHKVSRR